jgi:hypothetical protein
MYRNIFVTVHLETFKQMVLLGDFVSKILHIHSTSPEILEIKIPFSLLEVNDFHCSLLSNIVHMMNIKSLILMVEHVVTGGSGLIVGNLTLQQVPSCSPQGAVPV